MATTSNKPKDKQSAELPDELTFKFSLEAEKRQQRGHILRGEKAKTERTKLWADTQEVKRDRQQVKLETEEIKLQNDNEKKGIAEDNLKETQATGILNKQRIIKNLATKAYAVTGDSQYLQKAQQKILAGGVGQAVEFASTESTKEKAKQKA
ncbi:hypothetical protein NDI37_22000 [Funiculus sociatus GB2-A5]|uniref:DUF4355 domain-containing protein n=1 Tax=Funiculus sociatus GB2-A5 TaxID=2933946 RepID=A0ABV0JUR6_9CYAN|nr:hypothetical protein [Trichocoleus sp. FACHB-6]MBD2060770.1 hypothetical protein [Trichocoleus sp. FACHB-6]